MSLPINRITPGSEYSEIPYVPSNYNEVQGKLEKFVKRNIVITYTPKGFVKEDLIEGKLDFFTGNQVNIPRKLNDLQLRSFNIFSFNFKGHRNPLILIDGCQDNLNTALAAIGLIHSIKLIK